MSKMVCEPCANFKVSERDCIDRNHLRNNVDVVVILQTVNLDRPLPCAGYFQDIHLFCQFSKCIHYCVCEGRGEQFGFEFGWMIWKPGRILSLYTSDAADDLL